MSNDNKQSKTIRKRRPAFTPEGEEQQMISDAMALARQQLAAGTASAQVITHFLKLGSSSERREQELKEQQRILAEAKVEALKSSQRVESMVEEAMNAMRRYSGRRDRDDDDE